ncbi:MAG: hypothetical protein BGO55_03340 [Sphingobacteriales bacterium 50-39]|nr:hypothetical protein [Sphingobacteriales bacterium]OJW55588.1 MAG: hypothetical protein BGO55_03340 [Sphingobacteriales bacterium 50-39]
MKSKIRTLPKWHSVPQGDEETANERLSVAQCREILQEEGKELTDARIIEIRDYLYRLAAITWEEYEFRQQEKAKVITLQQHKLSADEKSDHLRTG